MYLVKPIVFEKLPDIKAESVLEVVGEKKNNEKAVNGYEIIHKKLEILTVAEQPVPLNLSEKGKG